MILGYSLIGIALAATVAAVVLFSRARTQERWLRPARLLAGLATIGVIGASAFLITLFATHQFQVRYVAEFSAKRAASKYLFAAFWGGQEGSILLWTFWTSILGALLAWRAGGKASRVWPIFGVIQTFLLVLLTLKSPFALGAGPVPADGRGLNPLLENPWMVIHPPILFLGFSSLVIPYVWTLYGLIYRDWDGWVQRAFPWALFSFSALGFGVALGGYWAYETLGWGGFWGWDPVENSSLVPWLFLTALLHGIAIQRGNGGYRATNFVLGFLPFAFMLYGTFLTRTGVLDGFSVHTFSSLGRDGFWILLGAVILATLVPLILLVTRFRAMPRPAAYERVLTREFGFFLASAMLGLIGLITAVGMSAPLLTKLWTEKGAAAQPGFYNQATFPLAILLTVAMAATPYFAWRATEAEGVLRRLFPAYAAAIALTFGMLLLSWRVAASGGPKLMWMLLLFATAIFAVGTNVLLILPRLRRRESRRTVGGFVAHTGAGLALAGIACLVAFGQERQGVELPINQPKNVLGYKLTYVGFSSQPYDRSNGIRVRVEKNGKVWEAKPRLYIAPWDGRDQVFANPPAIQTHLWGDLYLARNHGPLTNDASNPNAGFTMQAQQERTAGDYTFKFWGLDWSDNVRAAMKQGGMDAVNKLPEMRVKALMDVTYRGQKVSVAPEIVMSKQLGTYSVPATLPGPEGAPPVIMNLDQPQFPRGAMLSTTNVPDPAEVIFLDVSTKPMIWLVWLGTVLYTTGGLVAYRRRALELGLLGEEPDSAPPAPAPAPEGRTKRKSGKRTGRLSPEPARATAAPPRR